ncbi:MAG: RHS repeat-associated core domain-containing protein [Parachlamydiaceae bacterium]
MLSPLREKQEHSATANPWHYSGKRVDEESGLIAFGMRYYDPSLGRWTTPDPDGFIDGANLYAYVHNNPLIYVDQYGLFGESIFQPLQNFEWRRSLNSLPFYQSIETTAIDTWNSPRFQGSMQAIGGLAEASVGAGMTYATGGVAAPMGVAVMAHGLDHFFTGVNTAITGKYGDTITSQLLQMGGVSPENATTIDHLMSIRSTIGGARLAMNAASSSVPQIAKSAGHLGIQEVKCVTNEKLTGIATKSGRNRFIPDSNANGAHTVFRKDPLTGKLSHYETYRPQTNLRNPNPWESVKRYDGPQHEHYHFNKAIKKRVYAPHIHDPYYPGGIRTPFEWELPN